MKTIHPIYLLVFAWALALKAADIKELDRIEAMQAALDHQGIAGLLSKVSEENWRVPHMPSQWHVENIAKPEQRLIDLAARDLGRALTQRLNEAALDLQRLDPDDGLFLLSKNLCELTNWCVATEGYGNLLLVNRTVGLTAVGVARLTANLDFHLEKCETLVAGLKEPWQDVALRVRILNKEAGTEMFPLERQEEIDRIWATGRFLRMEQLQPNLRKILKTTSADLSRMRETQPMRARLGFFDELEVGLVKPFTLAMLWNLKWHDGLARGVFGSRNLDRARSLVEYRRAVGRFPEKFAYTDTQIKEHEQAVYENAKHGVRIAPLDTDVESLEKMGFAKAWEGVARTPRMPFEEWERRKYVAGGAWYAYDQVRRGEFLDEDTRREREWEREKERLRRRTESR